MADILIPQAVRDKASRELRGAKQMDILRAYVVPLLSQGDEVKDWRRNDKDEVFAVTGPFVPDAAEVPDRFKRKPKR